MSDAVWVAIIAAVPSILSTILGLFNRNKLNQVKDGVNGRLTELLILTRAHALQEGLRRGAIGEPASDEHETDDARTRRKELERLYLPPEEPRACPPTSKKKR